MNKFKKNSYNVKYKYPSIKPDRSLDQNTGKNFLSLIISANILDIENFLVNNRHIINFTDDNDNNALHIVINSNMNQSNKISLINLLLNNNIKLNYKNNNGDTPFILACKKNNTEVIKYLLNIPNIDIKAKNNLNLTALHIISEGVVEKCLGYKKPSKMIGDPEPLVDNIELSKFTKKLFDEYIKVYNNTDIQKLIDELKNLQESDVEKSFNDYGKKMGDEFDKFMKREISNILSKNINDNEKNRNIRIKKLF